MSATKFNSLAYLFVQKMVRRGRPLLRENLAETELPPSLKNADFQSIFARSASSVTPSQKVQLTRIGSPLRNERNLCQHSYTTWKIIHPSFL